MAGTLYTVDRGLILRETETRETDKILTLLTWEEGKIAVTARGARRKNCKFAAAAQPLAYAEWTLYQRKDWHYASDASTLDLFDGLRGDLTALALGCYMAELTEAVCPEAVPAPELLRHLLNGLYALSALHKPPALVKPTFELNAILSIIIMFLVTAVETIGDISGCIEGGMGREATAKELSGGVICDGCGSMISALFGSLPTTSFSQNVGLVTMTKVVNRMALTCGAIFLVLAGLSPKLAAVISIMPQSVLGGAAVMMFASIAVSGIKLVTKFGITNRVVTIVSIAMGLGFGLGATSGALAGMPERLQLIFGGSGIVPAAVLAIILNIVIPKEQEDIDNEARANGTAA